MTSFATLSWTVRPCKSLLFTRILQLKIFLSDHANRHIPVSRRTCFAPSSSVAAPGSLSKTVQRQPQMNNIGETTTSLPESLKATPRIREVGRRMSQFIGNFFTDDYYWIQRSRKFPDVFDISHDRGSLDRDVPPFQGTSYC